LILYNSRSLCRKQSSVADPGRNSGGWRPQKGGGECAFHYHTAGWVRGRLLRNPSNSRRSYLLMLGDVIRQGVCGASMLHELSKTSTHVSASFFVPKGRVFPLDREMVEMEWVLEMGGKMVVWGMERPEKKERHRIFCGRKKSTLAGQFATLVIGPRCATILGSVGVCRRRASSPFFTSTSTEVRPKDLFHGGFASGKCSV